jgi:hypothetical protein
MPALAVLGALVTAIAPAGGAQSIVLRLNPRAGDTLHTRLEQQTEVTGTRTGGQPMKTVTTSVVLNSRTIVHQSLPASTVVLTIVDSADIRTSDAHAASQVADAERSMRGQRMVMRLASDGTVESARDARGGALSGDLAQSMSSMPAVFPQQPVSVGDQWMREMPLPAGGPLGTRGAGKVIAAFRLDSVSRGGSIAYVSMQGEIRPDPASQGLQLSGGVQGSMKIDRARGWLTDSRFAITMRSLVTPSPASGLAPMRFVTRVVQRLTTMDKR